MVVHNPPILNLEVFYNYFTFMGSRDPPADHYELWRTWWSRRRYELFKFLYLSVKGFLFCEVLKIAIFYT
jgi:hypothetical protein